MKIKFELTEEEFNALQQLVDAGVRGTGMQGVRAAARMLAIFEEAVQVAQAEALASPAAKEELQ